jgi:hypothetical protein
MPPSSPPPAFAAFALAFAISACSPAPKPAESPEGAASKEESDTPPSPAPKAEATAADTDAPPPRQGLAEKAPDVDKSMSMDTYEMTPADCDALGRQYGALARADQMGALSPKLSEKQRAATSAQVDKVVSRLEETWINGCQSNLVNKAVDHDAIKCALAAKTVKAFDVCINGAAGAGQGTTPGKGKKK